jgi:uncharacterized repeat protein (TIGR01451 family)
VTKTSSVDSDPINDDVNPKAIPGAEIVYSIIVTNSGSGSPDNKSIVIVDVLPANMTFFAGPFFGSSPVAFLHDPSVTGLTYIFSGLASTTDSLDFSDDGGTSFAYVPAPDIDGLDPNVTHIRVIPDGIFAASDGTTDPSFEVQFKMDIN